MTKRIEQEQARELRRNGLAMKVIARQLGVSASSVHLWTADIELPGGLTNQLTLRDTNRLKANVARRTTHVARVLRDREQAEREWTDLRSNHVFLVGLALYLGEGSKTGSSVAVTNADPAMLRMALRFFQVINTDSAQVRAGIILHRGEDPEAALNYWSAELRLPRSAFHKVTASKVSGGSRAHRLVHGTARVRINAAGLKRKVMRWMELAKIEFGS